MLVNLCDSEDYSLFQLDVVGRSAVIWWNGGEVR